MKIELLRKYWPMTAKDDTDALDVGTVCDFPDNETARLVNAGIAKLVMDENAPVVAAPTLKMPAKG